MYFTCHFIWQNNIYREATVDDSNSNGQYDYGNKAKANYKAIDNG